MDFLKIYLQKGPMLKNFLLQYTVCWRLPVHNTSAIAFNCTKVLIETFYIQLEVRHVHK